MGEVTVSNFRIKYDLCNPTDNSSVDFRPDKLIVRVPSIGHEIMTDLFEVMRQSGSTYPSGLYRGSEIILGGSADIHYSSGYKSPDFSIYELRDGIGYTMCDDNTTPTIVFEVAYTQPSRSVSQEAARHICLTGGEILLVVVVNIEHKVNTNPRELMTVTWSYWEEDVDSYLVEDDAGDTDIDIQRDDGVDDTEYVDPTPATAFKAVIPRPGNKRYHIRATRTDHWEV
jgi:hypothetical protein